MLTIVRHKLRRSWRAAYFLPPRAAVIAAHAQEALDYNTPAYERRYGGSVLDYPTYVQCGDHWAAKPKG